MADTPQLNVGPIQANADDSRISEAVKWLITNMNVSEIDAGKILQKLDNSGGRHGVFKTTKSDLINIQRATPQILDSLIFHLARIPVAGSEKVSDPDEKQETLAPTTTTTPAKKKSRVTFKVGGRRRRRKSRKRNYTKKKQSKKKSRRRKTRRR